MRREQAGVEQGGVGRRPSAGRSKDATPEEGAQSAVRRMREVVPAGEIRDEDAADVQRELSEGETKPAEQGTACRGRGEIPGGGAEEAGAVPSEDAGGG